MFTAQKVKHNGRRAFQVFFLGLPVCQDTIPFICEFAANAWQAIHAVERHLASQPAERWTIEENGTRFKIAEFI